MVALLKQNEIRSVIKNGGIFNKWKENAMKIRGKGGPGSFWDILLTDLESGKSSLQKFSGNTS
jgi:hypothetical protein